MKIVFLNKQEVELCIQEKTLMFFVLSSKRFSLFCTDKINGKDKFEQAGHSIDFNFFKQTNLSLYLHHYFLPEEEYEDLKLLMEI